ncbi:restriction endonuclease subunit S [Lysobacter enzymogenes]|uniref:restriction endonuclease subunit S n=1 Tax=Lysobacter enzymogenes TaxID=69 RepID=UPI00384C01CD
MNLETLFEKFDLFADAPDVVPRIRELVLELAVRGGLVPHMPDEAPVPYDSMDDATPINIFETPENWRVVLLADAIRNRSGNSKLIKGKLHEGPAPGRFQGFSASGADVWCDDYEHEGEAIIVSAVGARCGKAFKASGKWSAIANTNIARPEPKLFDFDFAYLVLNNERFWVRGGSAQPFVKFPPSLDRHFALPPLTEQRRIVARVDELMALCDRLEAQQQERETMHSALVRASLDRFADAPTQANLGFLFHQSYVIPPVDFRKSILTLAVQGKLVPQDSSDEPAEELIARIATMRRVKRAKQYEPVLADEAPYEAPSSWAWVRLGNISLTSDSGWSPQCLPEARSGTDWGVLKVSAVSWGAYKPEENKSLPPGMTGRPSCEVKAGDFLLSRANTEELVARSVVVDQTPPRLMMSDKIVRFTFPDEIERAFVNLANTSDPSRAYYARNASGTSSSMKNIGREVMCNLPIALPPLAEQRRIVAKVDELMTLVDELESKLTAARTASTKLLAAAIAELTSGKETHAVDEV